MAWQDVNDYSAMLAQLGAPAAAADVPPADSVLPLTRRARAEEARRRQAELEAAPVDMAAYQEFAKRQAEMGKSALFNALAAQFAGQRFQPLQAHFLKQAAAAQEPMKLGRGMITPDGKFLDDPFAQREAQVKRLATQAQLDEAAAERADAAAVARQDRIDREAEARRRDERDYNNRVDQQQWMRQFQSENRDIKRAAQDKAARLPFGAVQEMSKQAGTAESMATIANTFKPEYASRMPGVPGIGSAENYLGRAGIGNKDRANWWQNYNEQANIIRNSLFGSALTLTEKAAFEAAMISPDMDAKVIQTRLNQQAAAAKRAYEKLVETAGASGYNTSGLPGVSGNVTGTPPGSGSTQPKKRIRFDAQGNEIP